MRDFIRPLLLLCLVALTISACDSGGDSNADSVTATGTLLNTFGRPVDGATLTFSTDEGRGAALPTFTVTTGADGSFSLDLPADTYTLAVSHPNYSASSSTVTIADGATATVATAPVAGPGGIETRVINSLDGSGVGGSSVLCSYRRPNGTYLAPPAFDFSLTTSSTGAVSVSGTPFGQMRCTVTAAFGTTTFDVLLGANGPTAITTVAATPLPGAGQFRVVLTWGTSPRDLDSHLTGPLASGGRFHVYFSSSASGNNNLDLDDTTGEGPETVTIDATVSGMYRYSVHNYTTQSTSGAAGIAASPTRVDLFGSAGLIRTYTAPAATSGNTWRVFEIDIAGTQSTIRDANGAGLGYVQADGAGDVTVFRGGTPALEVLKQTQL